MSNCCVCLSPFITEASRKKRKRLHGASCSNAKEVLEWIILTETHLSLSSYVETARSDAYLCQQCESKAKAVEKAEQEVKENVTYFVNKLSSLQHQPCQVNQAGKKSPSSSSEPSRKISCQDSTTTSTPDSHAASTSQAKSPNLKVVIDYQSGARTYNIHTPIRKNTVKRLTQKRFSSIAAPLVNSDPTAKPILNAFATKIGAELTDMCTLRNNSLLCDINEAVRQFSWDTVWLELQRKLPTLVSLLQLVLPKSSKVLVCFIISIILKRRSPHMALVQRAISVMLYANGVSKQTYKCLQPFMVCLSSKRTTALINRLSEDHNVDVLFWADDLKKRIKENPEVTLLGYDDYVLVNDFSDCSIEKATTSVSSSSLSDESDLSAGSHDCQEIDSCTSESVVLFDAPPVSSTGQLDIECDLSAALSENEEFNPPVTVLHTEYEEIDDNNKETLTASVSQVPWAGYKLTFDNLDKNFRPSFQRIDKQTNSLHCVHVYAAKDRIDLSSYSEAFPRSVSIKPIDILPTHHDFCKLKVHFQVLVSRVIVESLDGFFNKRKDIQWHIPFQHSKEMSSKSAVIPLG